LKKNNRDSEIIGERNRTRISCFREFCQREFKPRKRKSNEYQEVKQFFV